MSTSQVKTRLLILSDTHAAQPKPDPTLSANIESLIRADVSISPFPRQHTGFREPLPSADVVLHCGDLTKRSSITEFQRTFEMLRSLDAPLKLVIAGNHDGALDRDYWLNDCEDDEDLLEEAAILEEVAQVVSDAEADGVKYLTEGTYKFELENGATLSIYTSPMTPKYGSFGFQYERSEGHHFDIPPGMDVVMTHGPPRGILDLAGTGPERESAGCECLLRSIHNAKPKIHCFGHIHEAWGGVRLRWKDTSMRVTEARDAVDESQSKYILQLEEIVPRGKRDEADLLEKKTKKLVELSKERGVTVDLTSGEHALEQGKETLAINAAIMDRFYHPSQLPWVIDLDLPKTGQ